MNQAKQILQDFVSSLNENGAALIFNYGLLEGEESKDFFNKVYKPKALKVTLLEYYIMVKIYPYEIEIAKDIEELAEREPEMLNEMLYWLNQYGTNRVDGISEGKDYHLMVGMCASEATGGLCTVHNPIFWEIAIDGGLTLLFDRDDICMFDENQQIV